MRYTTNLHATPAAHTHKRHALQLHWLSTFIGMTLFGLVGIFLIGLTGRSDLSLEQILTGFGVSFIRVSVAYLISVVLAIGLALLITANARVESVMLPIFDVLQSFPSFALFPVLVAALTGAPEIIITIVLVITIIWPILFTIIGAIKNRRVDLEEAATVFGATGRKRFRNFTVPSLWPSIVTGSIVGWGEGWEFIIGAELLVSVKYGIGHYLGILGEANKNSALALGIVLLMFFLFITNKLIWLPLLRRATEYQSDT